MRQLALGFVTGVCLLWTLPELPGMAFGCVILGLGLWLSRYPRWRWLAALALGMVWAGAYAAWSLSFELPAAAENGTHALEATIAELPGLERGRLRLVARLESLDGVPLPFWQRARVRLGAANWTGEVPHVGERWRFDARLRRPHAPLNPGADDGERHLFEQGIRATGNLSGGGHRRLAEASALNPGRWRERLRDRLRSVLGDRAMGPVVVALVLGDDEAVPSQVWDVFRRTGTAHLVAISGSHMTLVAAGLFLVIGRAWRWSARLCLWMPARPVAGLGALVAIVGYSLLAGMSVPVQRALVMLLVLSLALLLRRRLAASTAFCLSLLAVVSFDPRAVLSAGFWLSFGAVALLLWLGSARQRRSGWREAARAQWGISVGLTPLLLLVFQQAPMAGPLANMLALPWFGFVVLPLSLLGTLLLPLWPQAGSGLVNLSAGCLELIYPVLDAMAHWTMAVWYGHVAFLPVMAATLATAWLLAPIRLPARGLAPLLAIPLLATCWRPASGPALRLTVLDVGQGLAAVVATRQHVLVFDAGYGEPGGYSAGARMVAPYLRAAGWPRIDTLVVSHGDGDHAGGVEGLRASIPVGQILSSVPERYESGERCQRGARWTWDGVTFEVLHPSGTRWRGNDGSCVLRVRLGESVILLTGDIEAPAERQLLANEGEALASTVIVAPHHGSAGSSLPDFVAAVHPRWVVFPVGYRNRFGFPREPVLRRYARQGGEALRTDRDGALEIDFTPGAMPEVHRFRLENRRIWRD